jgi:transposase
MPDSNLESILPLREESPFASDDLSEAAWLMLEHLLPAERGRKGRPAHDNRTIVNGILWRIRTGATWRHVPEKYGKWMTVYQRFRRWSGAGVWEVVASTLAQAENADHAIDAAAIIPLT